MKEGNESIGGGRGYGSVFVCIFQKLCLTEVCVGFNWKKKKKSPPPLKSRTKSDLKHHRYFLNPFFFFKKTSHSTWDFLTCLSWRYSQQCFMNVCCALKILFHFKTDYLHCWYNSIWLQHAFLVVNICWSEKLEWPRAFVGLTLSITSIHINNQMTKLASVCPVTYALIW